MPRFTPEVWSRAGFINSAMKRRQCPSNIPIKRGQLFTPHHHSERWFRLVLGPGMVVSTSIPVRVVQGLRVLVVVYFVDDSFKSVCLAIAIALLELLGESTAAYWMKLRDFVEAGIHLREMTIWSVVGQDFIESSLVLFCSASSTLLLPRYHNRVCTPSVPHA
jgi:hypothetical protein